MTPNFSIQEVRKDIDSIDQHLFFNSAGSSLPSQSSIRSMISFMKEEAKWGGYKLMMDQHERFQSFYNESSRLINAKPRNIAFQQSATAAFSQAIYSIEWQHNDVILTSQLEYVSNILSIVRLKERFNIEIQYVHADADGLIDINHLEACLLKYSPKAVVLTHIPTNTGVVQDAIKVGDLCQAHDCTYILDACQSIGHIQVDVEAIKCDFLSVTGRKYLRGPRGTGFLYVSDQFIENNNLPLCFDLAGAQWVGPETYKLSDDAKRWEYWEKNYSNLIGITRSISEINAIGIQEIAAYNKKLQLRYREVLSSIDGLKILEESNSSCSIITWRYKDFSKNQMEKVLNRCGVIYSFAMKESALIDMSKKGIDWAVRFSPHYFNTENEIVQFKELFLEQAKIV